MDNLIPQLIVQSMSLPNVPTLIVSWISWEMLLSLILSSKSPKVTFFPVGIFKIGTAPLKLSESVKNIKSPFYLLGYMRNMWLMALSRN